MSSGILRRAFLGAAAVGAGSLGALAAGEKPAAEPGPAAPVAPGRAKVRIGKVYAGKARPGWPMASVDVAAEQKRFEEQLARLGPALADIEFIDCGLVMSEQEIAQAKEQLKDADGILLLQLTMGISGVIKSLADLGIPVVLFSEPYCGHEWHIIASLQKQGKRIDCWASSRFEDIPAAIRPIRAIRRLKDAKVLHVSQRPADPKYVEAMKAKFGTQIKSLGLPELEEAYKAVPAAAAAEDAEQWIRNAEKIVEPKKEEIVKASRMALALKNLVDADAADAITINCLGMGLIDRDMAYPCLGFARLNSIGLGGICEADLKSTMTHLVFNFLVGKPGFVTDPCFDYATSTILHAHCVAATHMDGPGTPGQPYFIRSHLEDNRGVVLQVKLRTGVRVSMARLIGDDIMLFSTGEAVDSPLVDRGCRTKLAVRVENPERFLENWSCGLHRVIFYGDHTRDIQRFCRFMNLRLLREGIDDLREVPGLEWNPSVHA